jgi:DNA-binding NarL/FixJ family response regulator
VVNEVSASGSVLLVEDDEGFRSLVAEALRAAGYDVIEAATGAEAMACAGRARPDLALLDVALPGLSGYEVCRRLRERFGEELPIMFMSGERVEPYDRMAGLFLGADDYLVKPFELEVLLALIRKHRRRVTSARHGAAGAELTARQLEVLHSLAEGLDQNEIAARLDIRPKTVGAHLEQIFMKLGVHSRAQAVAHAYREHLLETV